MYKTYFGAPGAQIHARILNEESGTPIICLPPAPHTGLYFDTFAQVCKHHIVAVDYPGYGGSDPLGEMPTIEAYAKSLSCVLGTHDKVHLLGFHTGNLVALELVYAHDPKIERVILIDIPFYDPETRRNFDASIGQAKGIPRHVDDLKAGFETNITKRIDDLGEMRAFEIWGESLRAANRSHQAFHAAFQYDCEAALKKCTRPVNVIATQSSLLAPTRNAAKLLSNASLQERLDISGSVFDAHAKETADLIGDLIS